MGPLENKLRPHLEKLTKFYEADNFKWMSKYESSKIDKIKSEQNAKSKSQRSDTESMNYCQQGNQFYKAEEYNQALCMYTKSIAAAIEGPLASLAYFNRSQSHFHF
jgi:hypothetical protein